MISIAILLNRIPIVYNKEKINKYLDFVCYYDFDIREKFIEYIIFNYMYQLDLIDIMKNNSFIYISLKNLIDNKKIIDLNLACYLIKYYEINQIKNINFDIYLLLA